LGQYSIDIQDEKGSDEKILCVPLRDPIWSHVQHVSDLQPTVRAEVEHFFEVYKDLEGHKVKTEGFGDRDEALQVIEEARERSGAART